MINPFTRSGNPFRCETMELGKTETITGDWFDSVPTFDFADFTAGVDFWQGANNGNILYLAYSDGAGGGNFDVRKFRKYIASFESILVDGDVATTLVQITNSAGDTALASFTMSIYGRQSVPLIPNADDSAGYGQFFVSDNSGANTTRTNNIRFALNIHNINRRYH